MSHGLVSSPYLIPHKRRRYSQDEVLSWRDVSGKSPAQMRSAPSRGRTCLGSNKRIYSSCRGSFMPRMVLPIAVRIITVVLQSARTVPELWSNIVPRNIKRRFLANLHSQDAFIPAWSRVTISVWMDSASSHASLQCRTLYDMANSNRRHKVILSD